MRYRFPVICSFFLLVIICTTPVGATEDFARKTGKDCSFCHLDPSGGGELTKAGEGFLATLPGTKGEKADRSASQLIRFAAGLIHLFTAILWFGTILYVHLLLKPAYAARGLPKGELFVGWASIVLMAGSGGVLTYYRVNSLHTLFHTRFGILLILKVLFFAVMVGTAFYVTFVLAPKMKKMVRKKIDEESHDLTVEELSSFDGTEGRRSLIAYQREIYDVTESTLWKRGTHGGKHRAGFDLTDMLHTAPHGEEVFEKVRKTGTLVPSGSGEKIPPHVKLFYFLAYSNLVIVFLIIFIVAAMRWW